jgi:hypothetical protein
MEKNNAIEYVGHHLEDIGPIDARPITDQTYLVGWQCGFEPMFVAVHDHLNYLDESDAEQIAIDHLEKIGWFTDGPVDADYILT